jgi:capsular polysaccharide biosynthesis protein
MYVSIDYARLYPGGAGFPEPDSTDTTDLATLDAAAFGIHVIDELYPAHSYGLPFDASIFVEDTEATRHLWPLYQHLAVQSAPSSILVAIAEATVFASVLYCGNGDTQRIVYETQRPNDRDATTLPTRHALAHATLPPGFDTARDHLFVGSAGSFNYGHFLIDDLPRVRAVAMMQARRPGRGVTIVMTSYGVKMDIVRSDAIVALCEGDVRVLFLDASRPYRLPGLHYASPVSYHPIRKHVPALDFLVTSAARAIPGQGGGERVFIERGTGGPGRLLVNEAQLVGQLRESGFTIIRPDRMTFGEQVLALRNARTVIGQMGAAMTNAIFAPDHATLIYLAPAGWIEPFYWDLANARRQRYRVLYGRSLTTNRPPHESDFLIDPATFSAIPEIAVLAGA